jgi:predicted unusual protein kinase regulating ubiquinone biosynthesis (AarF/ABC1/UbiB family)
MILFNISKCLLLSLLIKYNFYNNRIIKILLKNIHSCGVIPVKIIQWALPLLKLISIDKNILNVFENTYEKCPNHNIEYTKELYKKDFYNDIDDEYKIIELVGSGSIAQVYKIQDIKSEKYYAMKVIHPKAIENFITIKFYLKIIFTFYDFTKIIPTNLDNFLNQFEEQLNLINESNNIMKFNEIYKNNNLFIIPELYKISKNIIIMDYVEGKSIETITTNIQHYKYNMIISIFMYNNLFINSFNHGDLHNYNWKITDDNKIIVYDFGLCWESNNTLTEPLDDLFLGFYQSNNKLIYKAFKSYFKDIDDKIIKEYFDSIPEKIDKFFIFSKYILLFSLKHNILLNINILYTIITYQNSLLIYMKNFQGGDFDFNGIYKEQYNICDYYNILPEYQKYLLKQIDTFKKKDNIDYSSFNKFIK